MKKHNIVFTGVMAAILLSAGAANAATITVASQGYVNSAKTAAVTESKTYTDEQIEALDINYAAADTALETKITTAYEAADEATLAAAKAYADENDADTIYDDTELKASVAANTSAVSELEGDVEANTTKIGAEALPDTYVSLTDAVTKLKTKTDSMATTEGMTELTNAVEGLTNAQGTGTVDVLVKELDTAEAAIEANKTAIEGNTTAIEILNGTGEGSVSKAIADANATITADVEKKLDAETFEAYKTTNDAAVKANADAITDMDAAYKAADIQVLTDAKAYTDSEIAEFGFADYATCTATAPLCVWGVDNAGNYAWIGVTPDPVAAE